MHFYYRVQQNQYQKQTIYKISFSSNTHHVCHFARLFLICYYFFHIVCFVAQRLNKILFFYEK